MFSFAYTIRAFQATRGVGITPGIIFSRERGTLLDARRRRRWEVLRGQSDGVVTTLYGPRVALDTSDTSWMTASLGVSRVLRVAVSELLRRLLRPGETFVDVGANVGYYTALASRWVGPSGHVLALEPQSENYARLQRSIELNVASNVRALQLAASDETGDARLFLDSASSIGHSLRDDSARRSVSIRADRLDSIFSAEMPSGSAPGVIKIHTGVEPRVLRGASQLLERFRPHLLFIHHPSAWRESDDVYALLRKQGFRWFEVVDSPLLVRATTPERIRDRTVELYLAPGRGRSRAG